LRACQGLGVLGRWQIVLNHLRCAADSCHYQLAHGCMNASVTHPDKEPFWNLSPGALSAHLRASAIRFPACIHDKTNKNPRRINWDMFERVRLR
jgi:hypothetical protein